MICKHKTQVKSDVSSASGLTGLGGNSVGSLGAGLGSWAFPHQAPTQKGLL